MRMIRLGEVTLHYAETGPADGPALVFANSLGTDFRLWDDVLPLLPAGLRVIRYDKRGHGLSSCPAGEWGMADLVADAARLLDALRVRESVFVGLSIGGMIAQGLAAERPDLVRAMVLACTAAKIGTPQMWQQRVDAVRAGGIEALADAVLERWFSRAFRTGAPEALEGWRNMLVRTPADGYAACCAAIAETELHESTSRLRLPTLAIAGTEDGATPPDLVRETAELIPGARFALIRGAGHMPCVEAPETFAAELGGFLRGVGHL